MMITKKLLVLAKQEKPHMPPNRNANSVQPSQVVKIAVNLLELVPSVLLERNPTEMEVVPMQFKKMIKLNVVLLLLVMMMLSILPKLALLERLSPPQQSLMQH